MKDEKARFLNRGILFYVFVRCWFFLDLDLRFVLGKGYVDFIVFGLWIIGYCLLVLFVFGESEEKIFSIVWGSFSFRVRVFC